MRLHVHRSAERFLEALTASSDAHYAVFTRSNTRPSVLRAAATIGRERGHHDIVTVRELRSAAESLLRDFFDAAVRADPEWRYAFSSRVPLAIPDYPDVTLIFMLRALNAMQSDVSAHVMVEDEDLARLAHFAVHGGAPAVFASSSVRGFARAARSFLRAMLASKPRNRADVVIFTLGDNVANGTADAYFGDFAGALARTCRVLTVYAAPGQRVRFPARPHAVPLEAFLNLADPVRAWTASNSISRQGTQRASGSDIDSALISYLRTREHSAGEVTMQRVMATAFDRAFARVQPRVVLYPFENRSWEKNLLKAARRNAVARCIGYQHSSITPRHLAFHGAAGLSGLDDLPDTILTCGELTAERIRCELPQARTLVIAGAALRAKRLRVGPPPNRGLLVPISSSRAEAWELLSAVERLAQRSNTSIVVRTHPTIPIDDLYAQFQWPAHVTLSRGKSLAEDFGRTAFVVYSSSTVALEGMLYERLPIYLEIGDIPSGNPIGGEPQFVFRAETADALVDVVSRLETLPQDILNALRKEARAYAERYLVEPTPERVDAMTRLVAPC